MSRNETPALHDVTLTHVRRLASTPSGNARYTLAFSDGTMVDTASNADVNSDVMNVFHRGARVDVYLTKAGRVSWWRPCDTERTHDDAHADDSYERAQLARIRDAVDVTSYAVQIDARHDDGTTSTKWLAITRDQALDIGRLVTGDAIAVRAHYGETYRRDY